MLGQDSTTAAVAAAGAPQVPLNRPRPEQRVVEGTAKSTLQQFQTGPMFARMPTAIEQLSRSARQFARVLESTGSVQVASGVSGFVVGYVDTYA